MTKAVSLATSVASGVSLGFKNRIINGAMMIDQRNAGASVTTPNLNSIYTLDRWVAYYSQTSKFTVQQNAGSVAAPVGFKNYLGITSSSAYSVLSNDFFSIRQSIEGLNVADLGWGAAGAATVTLSFLVRSSLTGTFGGSLNNSGNSRCYPFSYTISSANTWTQISVTIAGDTSGTWLTTNGIGIQVIFGLGMGSTYSGTAGSWSSSEYYSVTGATSVVGTSGATFYVTGVQLEVGSSATNFEYRDYGRELIMCQRYYQMYALGGGAPNGTPMVATKWSASDAIVTLLPMVCSMRATPTGSRSVTGTNRYVNSTPSTPSTTFGTIAAWTANGPAYIACTNNAVAASYGWLDDLGTMTLTAEL